MSKTITDEALLAAIKASAAGEAGAEALLKQYFPQRKTPTDLPQEHRSAFLNALPAKPLRPGDPLPGFDWHNPRKRVYDPNEKKARRLEQQVNEEERKLTGGNRYKIPGIDD